jgi:23S rRNA-/tRNA-specific pseudouridylate synthase
VSLNILYEDDHLIVLNKAAGQLVIPARGLLKNEDNVGASGRRLPGRKSLGAAARLMLHAYQISFRHPSGKMVTFCAETAEDWMKVLAQYKT